MFARKEYLNSFDTPTIGVDPDDVTFTDGIQEGKESKDSNGCLSLAATDFEGAHWRIRVERQKIYDA